MFIFITSCVCQGRFAKEEKINAHWKGAARASCGRNENQKAKDSNKGKTYARGLLSRTTSYQRRRPHMHILISNLLYHSSQVYPSLKISIGPSPRPSNRLHPQSRRLHISIPRHPLHLPPLEEILTLNHNDRPFRKSSTGIFAWTRGISFWLQRSVFVRLGSLGL